MNGPLLDEVYRRGLLNLIPDTPKSIGRAMVGLVLTYLATHADAQGRIAYGAAAIADDLGMNRRPVTEALDVLADLGIIARTGGKRGRAIEYRLAVEAWPTTTHRAPRLATDHRATQPATEQSALTLLTVPEPPVDNGSDVSGDVSGHVSGHVSGPVSGYPGTKGREVKREGGEPPTTTAPVGATEDSDGPPPPCKRHTTGWHHDDPCRACGDLRRWHAAKPAPRQPVHRAPTEPLTFTDPDVRADYLAILRAAVDNAADDVERAHNLRPAHAAMLRGRNAG